MIYKYLASISCLSICQFILKHNNKSIHHVLSYDFSEYPQQLCGKWLLDGHQVAKA